MAAIFVPLVGMWEHVGDFPLALDWGGCVLPGLVLTRSSRVLCRSLLLSTFSPCAGRHFISLSNGDKETEAKKTPTNASF
jgi:hypothetical protein